MNGRKKFADISIHSETEAPVSDVLAVDWSFVWNSVQKRDTYSNECLVVSCDLCDL